MPGTLPTRWTSIFALAQVSDHELAQEPPPFSFFFRTVIATMLSTIMNAGHKVVVLGLVGATALGGYTIGSGLFELRGRRLAWEAQNRDTQASPK